MPKVRESHLGQSDATSEAQKLRRQLTNRPPVNGTPAAFVSCLKLVADSLNSIECGSCNSVIYKPERKFYQDALAPIELGTTPIPRLANQLFIE